ncbi:MAG: hypothetical protein GWN29_04845 [Gammaproteobacteria bacterium]|nr:hypothetical protein [Gammaproteobacteria bacterium]
MPDSCELCSSPQNLVDPIGGYLLCAACHREMAADSDVAHAITAYDLHRSAYSYGITRANTDADVHRMVEAICRARCELAQVIETYITAHA